VKISIFMMENNTIGVFMEKRKYCVFLLEIFLKKRKIYIIIKRDENVLLYVIFGKIEISILTPNVILCRIN
jgi:hypothetical protein